jgi:SAM-dependent methyltransferase
MRRTIAADRIDFYWLIGLQSFGVYHRVHGCDIDGEQIEWCAANLPKARFAVISPFPPTLYADNMFDIVTSWSVLTHLRRDVQLDWLKEMSRIIAPGGLFSASVSGESLLNLPPLKDSLR